MREMIGKIVLFVAGIIIGISVCDVFADADAEEEGKKEYYHIGIVIDKSCETINQLDKNKCAGYEDVEKIFPDTKIKSHMMPDTSKYSHEQQIKFREKISVIKNECVRTDACDFLDIGERQETVIWHNPDARIYPYMDIITIRGQMKISAIYDVSQKTISETDDKLKSLSKVAEEKRSSLESNFKKISAGEKNKEQSYNIIKKHANAMGDLEREISQKEVWAEYERADPKFSEDRKAELKKLKEQYESKVKLKEEEQIILADLDSEAKELEKSNKELQKELREISIKMQTNKDKLMPRQTISQTDSATRQIVFNVNQIYTDIACKNSFFAVNNLAIELQSLINFMSTDCENRELLFAFSLTHVNTIPKHQLDVTTSPNWQYQQELKELIIKCKVKC